MRVTDTGLSNEDRIALHWLEEMGFFGTDASLEESLVSYGVAWHATFDTALVGIDTHEMTGEYRTWYVVDVSHDDVIEYAKELDVDDIFFKYAGTTKEKYLAQLREWPDMTPGAIQDMRGGVGLYGDPNTPGGTLVMAALAIAAREALGFNPRPKRLIYFDLLETQIRRIECEMWAEDGESDEAAAYRAIGYEDDEGITRADMGQAGESLNIELDKDTPIEIDYIIHKGKEVHI